MTDALVFAAAPLLVGPAILTAFELTAWRWLIAAGLITLPVGLTSLMIALTEVCRYLLTSRRAGTFGRTTVWRAVAACLLAAANVPAAYLCVKYGFRAVDL